MTNWFVKLFSPKRKKSRRRKSTRTSRRRKSKRTSRRRTSGKRRNSHRKNELTIKSKIKSKPWFIMTMKGCGYCTEAKKLLMKNHQKYGSLTVTDKNKDNIWVVTDKIAKKRYRYFPMVFKQGKFFGGFSELSKEYTR